MGNYVKGKGILVGVYSEDDIIAGKDKIEVEKAMAETGLKYTHSELKRNRKTKEIESLTIYVCRMEDFN